MDINSKIIALEEGLKEITEVLQNALERIQEMEGMDDALVDTRERLPDVEDRIKEISKNNGVDLGF